MWDKYPRSIQFKGKTLLAIDYGQKFTGLSTFHIGRDPYPLTYGRIRYQNDNKLVQEILEICSMEDVDIIILGVPKLLDGKETTMTKTILQFADKLKAKWDEALFFTQDETLSTFEAKERMKNSAQYNFQVDMNKVDEVAACIILEDFLKMEL